MDLLVNANKWYDGLDAKWWSVIALALLGVALLLAINLPVLAWILYAGLAVDRIWWGWFYKKPTT